jgi:hypothetical protein
MRIGIFLLTAICLTALIPSTTIAQSRGAGATIPDITGSWERYRSGPGRGAAGGGGAATTPPPAPQPPLKPQYLKEYQAKVQAAREADAKGEPLATNATLCLPEGMPGMMGATFPMEILQSRGQVTIIEEAYNQVRRILMDQLQLPIDDVEPGFYGRSVGHWEGDTLVVDTVGVKENVRYQNVPHSKDMRIKERIRFVSPEILWDEITIEDPVTFEKPWTFTNAYRRMPGYTLLEYICEDNREYAGEDGKQKIRIGPAVQ